MGAVTNSGLGDGLGDSANQSLTLRIAEDILSDYNLTNNTLSTYVSGGFDSLGNAYTSRPIGIIDVTVRVGRSGSANVGITPIFKTSLSGNSPSRVNSTTILYTSSLPVSGDTSLSTEPEYVYPLLTSDLGYYGFRGVSPSGVMEYGSGGRDYIYSVYQLIQSTINSGARISGSITRASIPSAPGSFYFTSIPTDTTIYLAWNPPADDGMQNPAAYSASNIKGYRINYRNDPEENWKVLVANTGSNATTATVTGLSASTYYELQFAALNVVTDEHNRKAFYTGNESPFDYSSITAHVGVRGPAQSFTTAVSTNDAKIWNGSAFKKSIIKIWDGAAWIQYPNVRAKVWNGTAFQNLVLDS
jgi:hypothetical protein